MKLILTLLLLALCGSAFGQTPAPPTQLSYMVDAPSGCAPQLLSCVSQVNGVPVCPYGRATWTPLPGQPYTILTYPKLYPDGKTSIYSTMCVYVLQYHPFAGDPLFDVPPFLF